MSKFSIKFSIKKGVVALLLFSLSLVLVFFLKTDWFKKPAFLDEFFLNLSQKFNKIPQALAQEYLPYFFPRFPQRLIYLLSEINLLNEELVKTNEELNNLLSQSDCQFAISECLPKIFSGGTGCQPGKVLGIPYQNIKEIDEKKQEIADQIDSLFLLKELLKKEVEGGLPKELETLRPEVAEELRNNLEEVLAKNEEIILAAKENQNLYNQDYTKNCLASCQPGPVCGIKACAMLGTGPQKQIEIKAKVGVSLDDLKLGKVEIDKFSLALPDKMKFPSLGDIALTIPPQTLSVCFPLQSITVSVEPPSLATLPTLSFECPKLPWDLRLPELLIPKIPKEISIPSPSIPEIKWCPAIPEISGLEDLEKIRQELIAEDEQEIGKFKNKIDQAINQINEALESATEEEKKKLEKMKEELLQEYEKVKEEIPKEEKTPPTEFKTSGPPKEYQYQSPESTGLEFQDVSLSYQCGQTSGDEKVETGAETNWHFSTVSWLMENCASLPTMSSDWGLQEKAVNCYNPDKVIETINEECALIWQNYCSVDETGNPLGPEPPEICKKIRYGCSKDSEMAAGIQCHDLFKQEGLTIPPQCSYIPAYYNDELYYCLDPEYPILREKFCLHKDFDPVPVLKNKCQELKEKYPQEPPEACKILSLFTGQFETPNQEAYSGKGSSCPAQKLLNLPFGFGGGLGFNCSLGLPSLPKIVLPDIVIPDIILPEFGVPPFFKVKLPKIIFEDLILPDVELCDLNNCSNIFPSLYFKLLQLRLPSIDLSIPIPKLPGLDLRTRVDFPEINFSLPQINLFNLLLPELKLPEISLPSPKINFAITGIDLGPILDYIATFILNALDIPDFGGCLTFKIPSVFLSTVFPDYYFSFLKFPKLPKIPFCQDINQFCQEVKNSLGEGGWLKKAKEIENHFNKIIDKIQKELDKVSEAIEDVEGVIDEVFEETFGRAIYDSVVEQLAKQGLTLEDYINPKTEEIDLSKVPFPGVFPLKMADREGKEIGECLPVSTPQVEIILRIGNYQEKKTEKLSPFQYLIYVPVDIPSEISIPWPEKLKRINLINPLTYELPTIPLGVLNYEKEFPIKTFGFQPRTFAFDFGRVNEGDCLAEPPKGGNPFPIDQITSKINEIKNIKSAIDSASQTIIRILE